MKINLPVLLLATTGYLFLVAYKNPKPVEKADTVLVIYPDSILNNVSHHLP